MSFMSFDFFSHRIELQCGLRDLWHERIVGVGIRQQGGDRQQDLGDGEGGAPLILQDVEADCPVRIHVAVIDLRREIHLGWLEGVIRRELDVQEEDAASVGAVWGPHDRCLWQLTERKIQKEVPAR